MVLPYELAFVGAGNMAEGIVAAVVGKGVYPARAIVVSDPVPQRREMFARRFGVAVTEDNRELVAASRRIVMAVKPQAFNEVAAGMADLVTGDHVFISIMAGKSTRVIAEALAGGSHERTAAGEAAGKDSRAGGNQPGTGVRVVRVMPNLPILVGAGMAGICGGTNATPRDLAEVQAIFDAGGGTVVIDDESLMDAVTAVSGSGPAYFYYFVEAMVEGAMACGLTEADALKLAEFTCLGAARMMLETGEPPAELRAKVTSKGGTTQAALESMRQAGVQTAVREAVVAAFRRGRELAG